jgi:tRNA (mo5U34)-methyltransferase
VTPEHFLAGDGDAPGTTLSDGSPQLSNWFPRAVSNRIEHGPAGFREPTRERKTCEGTKSPLRKLATRTERNFWEIKLAHRPESFWYPYHTLRNVGVLEQLLASTSFDFFELCQGPHGKIADIGGADGDLAFFLERMGLSVDLIDNEPTNFNRLEGARILRETLHSNVRIRTVDLDSQFTLSGEKYDVIFFLGTLYHLKNPFFLLESLARITKYCFLSTRIARQTADGLPLASHPVAYLLEPRECNNDDTNFWIFSDQGLKRLIDRTGWNLLSYLTIGDTTRSTPADPERDERAFCLLGKRPPSFFANPNPVPAGEGPGKTTVSWDTADGSIGRIYVSVNRGQETLFADGRNSSASAHWIETGSEYEFRLYNSEHTELLARVTVTRKTQ